MIGAGLLLAAAAGTLLGCATGLVPGLHPNTLAALLAGVLWLGPTGAVLLVTAAVAHTFLNVVPSLVLGVTDPDLALSVLPGHALVRRGQGQDALLASAHGSLLGLLAALAVVPLLPVLARNAPAVPYRPLLVVGLVGLAVFLVVQERGRVPLHRTVVPVFDGVVEEGARPVGLEKVSDPSVRVQGVARRVDGDRFVVEEDDARHRVEDVHGWARTPEEGAPVDVHGHLRYRPGPGSRPAAVVAATAVFLAAGLLGTFVGDLPTPGSASMLLPLLTGLFGGGTLLLARGGAEVPRQVPGVPPEDAGALGATVPGLLAGVLVAGLPSVTAAQGTAIATLGRRRDPLKLLTTLSAVNTSAAVLALGVLVAFDRVRTGIAAALARQPTLPPAGVLFGFALVAGCAAFVALRVVGRRIVRRAPVLGRPRVTWAVLGAIAVIVAAMTGVAGLVVFGVASLLGTVPPRLGVRRVHLMGALVVPLIVGLLGI